MEFDGVSDSVGVTRMIDGNNFTLMAWIKTDTNGAGGSVDTRGKAPA